MGLLLVFQALYDLEKWMGWNEDRREWNDQELDSPDPFGSLRERCLSRLLYES